MKTLKELIAFQQFTNEDDLTIIKQWFIKNDLEHVGLTLIPALAKSQTEKIQRKYDYALLWAPILQDMYDHIEDSETAKMLNKLQLLCTLDYPLNEQDNALIWAKENIHNKMKVPSIFFVPTVAYLMKYGVEFVMTEEERERVKRSYGGMF